MKSYIYNRINTKNISLFLFIAILIGINPTLVLSQVCPPSIFRTIDGTCNNLSPLGSNWGAAKTPLFRQLPAAYSSEDIFNSASFPNRPNPRAISNLIFNQEGDSGNEANLSSMVFTWGQFIDHDITLVEESRVESITIPLPPDEISFSAPIQFHRSAIDEETGNNSPRNQKNELTAWIDASQVYGSDADRASWLRSFSEGKLKTSSGNLLPYNTLNGEKSGSIDPNAPEMATIDGGRAPHFVAGDIRASEQPGLTTLHTLFLREHNRLCDELISQGYQNEEEIYQIARKQVGAIIQAITYQEFLPALGISLQAYQGYQENSRPDIMNIFAAAAYRIGHTMVTSELLLLDDNCASLRSGLSLEQSFFNASWIEQYGIDPFIKGLTIQEQETIDAKVVDGLRNFLFSIPQVPGSFGLDLATLNIQRGRDHGIPDYNTIRRHFLGNRATAFSQISRNPKVAQQLTTIYNNDLDNIDPWVGLLTEDPLSGSTVGPTMHSILKLQFERLRNGDFFYYENDPFFSFTAQQTIKNTPLSAIVKRNTALNNLPRNVFFASPCNPVATFDCEAIQVKTVAGAIEISGLDAPFVTVKIFDKNNNWAQVAQCFGNCEATQLFDLPEGDYFINIGFYEQIWQNLSCEKDIEITIGSPPPPNTTTCNELSINGHNGQIAISNIVSGNTKLEYLGPSNGYATQVICDGDCGNAQTISNLPIGAEYTIKVQSFNPYCYAEYKVTITNESNHDPDKDGDGIPASQDCNDNDPNLTVIGNLCSDGNPTTSNDYIQNDCTCKGTPIDNGGAHSVISCGETTVIYGNGQVQITGLLNKEYFFKINDITNGWTVFSSCNWNCGNKYLVDNLPNGQYHLTVYNTDWSQHCSSPIAMTNSSFSSSSVNRAMPQFTFGAFLNQRQVELQWVTNTGYKNESYQIERSFDGIQFETIGQFNNKDWTDDMSYHQGLDSLPKLGKNYYRIKQVYVAGDFDYSTVQVMDIGFDVAAFAMYPNPAKEELHFNLSSFQNKSLTLQIVSNYGLLMKSINMEDVQGNLLTINLDKFPNGLYQVLLRVDGQQGISKKLIIEHLY